MLRQKKTTQKERDLIVQRFHESGLSQKVFAETNGINYTTLNKWLRAESSEEDVEVGFVQVQTSIFKKPLQSITITKAGMDIKIPLDLDINYFRKIVEVLAAV